MSKLKNEIGNKYGRLTVIGQEKSTCLGQSVWLCQCDCGEKQKVVGSSLRSHKTNSCGCIRDEKHLLPKGEAAFNKLLYSYKYGAKKRGIMFEITDKQFKDLISNKCHYCGTPPLQQYKTQSELSGGYIYNGVDRKDNKVGYTLENSISCCGLCNRAKMDMKYDDFINWIKKAYAIVSV